MAVGLALPALRVGLGQTAHWLGGWAVLTARVGSVVQQVVGVLGAVWAHPFLSPLRWLSVPVQFVFGRLITGSWVPSGPWMAIWMLLGFASSVQNYKNLLKLTAQLLMAQKGAACNLCDTVIGLMLKFDENSPEDIDCAELCPFGIASCIAVCARLVDALKSSSRYPCVTVGMCPDVDEPPECELKMPFFACEPASLCTIAPRFPRPRCELLPGPARWNKWKGMIGHNVGAFASALSSRPYCSDPGAHESFCVKQSTGAGWVFEMSTLALIVLAFALSIHALETEGAEDDTQWLTFWIITFLVAIVERLTDVLLSRYDDLYYGCKFAFMIWLIFLRGAESTYNRFRSAFVRVAAWLDHLDSHLPMAKLLRQRSGATSLAQDRPRLSDVVTKSAVAQRIMDSLARRRAAPAPVALASSSPTETNAVRAKMSSALRQAAAASSLRAA